MDPRLAKTCEQPRDGPHPGSTRPAQPWDQGGGLWLFYKLITQGIYRRVRHPMHLALLKTTSCT